MTMLGCLLVVVSLAGAIAAHIGAMKMPNVQLEPHHKFGLRAISNKVKVENIATGSSFPANPEYGIVQYFSDDSCGSMILSSSNLLDTCMASEAGGTSVMYTCDGDTAMQITYTDTTCTTVDEQNEIDVGTCMSGVKVASCGSDAYDLGSKDFVASSDYQSSDCSKTLGVTGFINNKCYSSGGGSMKFDWPNGYLYSSASCSGSSTDHANMEDMGCTANGTGDDMDDPVAYGAYNEYSHVDNGASSRLNVLSTGAILGLVAAVVFSTM